MEFDATRRRPSTVSLEEYARRLEAVREILERLGYEALLVFANPLTPGAITYLTGYAGIFVETWCVVTADSCSLVVGPEYVHTGGASWLDRGDIHHVQRVNDQIPIVMRLLGSRNRVALAGGPSIPWPLYQALRSSDLSRSLESADLLDGLRSRKSQVELQVITEACSVADRAAATFASCVAPGVTEAEVAALVETSLRGGGLSQLAFPIVLGSGERSLEVTMLPTQNAIQPGDMVLLDCGARYLGYCSDIARSRVAGNPSARQRDLLGTVRLMYQESLSLLRPGTHAWEVHRRAGDVAASAGYEFRYALGHGIGCDVHEYPLIDRTSVDVLEENMVVAIEPQLYVQGVGGVRLENTILITSDGPIELTGRTTHPAESD